MSVLERQLRTIRVALLLLFPLSWIGSDDSETGQLGVPLERILYVP
jgi:hypothetical protein